MQRIVTTGVGVVADLDQHEGWVVFNWSDPTYGEMSLKVDGDHHCSREMPVRSGTGPPDFVSMSRASLVMRFAPELASKLELDEEVEFVFELQDDEFGELKEVIETWFGLD